MELSIHSLPSNCYQLLFTMTLSLWIELKTWGRIYEKVSFGICICHLTTSFQFEKDSCLQASTERLQLPSECAGVKAQDIQFKKKNKQKNPETDKQGIGVIQRTISFSLGELVGKKLTCIAPSRPSMRQVTAVIWYLWQSNYWKLLNGLMIIHSGFQVSPKVGMNAFCCLPQLTFPVKSSVLKPYDI